MTSKDSNSKYTLLSPRFWHGMQSGIWFRALARNRFRVSLARLHLALGVTSFMPLSDTLAFAQHVMFGKSIAATKLVGPPVFVLGHWRSGTTLLHELLALDTSFAYPSTFQCFAPAHFLLTEDLVSRYGNWLIPNKRPMDNMKAGWSLPQEDEFALMNLGAPTPYLRMMFPGHPYPFQGTLSSDGFSPEELERWRYLFDWFLKAVTYKTKKPLILKSPPHTGRIRILRSMYPDAKFVHIVRDPRKLFPSTMKLWKALDSVQGLQPDENEERLRSFVFDSLRTMYSSFEADRVGIPSNQLTEVRYEDLARDPSGVVRQIYSSLELPGFESIEAVLRSREKQEKEYKTNQFTENAQDEAEILHQWRDYATKYGYA